MTIGELINYLSKMDQSIPVYLYDHDPSGYYKISRIFLMDKFTYVSKDGGYDGDIVVLGTSSFDPRLIHDAGID